MFSNRFNRTIQVTESSQIKSPRKWYILFHWMPDLGLGLLRRPTGYIHVAEVRHDGVDRRNEIQGPDTLVDLQGLHGS